MIFKDCFVVIQKNKEGRYDMEELIKGIIGIIIGVFILFFIYVISQRKKKRAFYPIENIDMNKEQREYVLKELSKVSKLSMHKVDFRALEYKNKIIYRQLENKDIEELNAYLSRLGLYLFGFEIC